MITCQYNTDFTSFYSSALAARQGHNPYQAMITSFLPVEKESYINLNPPIILLLFYPLTFFSYPVALNIWLTLSIIFGLIGAWFTFNIVFSQYFVKKNWMSLYTAYLFLFSTLICLSANQVGTLLLLCLMLGYHFHLKNNDYPAGIIWGFIIGLKLFPGLLFFYILRQNRNKLFAIMLVTIVLCFLIPLLVYGGAIYSQFYHAMTGIEWYENPWNGSVLAFIHRVFAELHYIDWTIPTYIIILFLALIGYLWSLSPNDTQDNINHQPFCLTLVMMLVLSPLGWIYYFPILLFPIMLLWTSIMKEHEQMSQSAKLWLTSLFLLNFPTAGLTTMQVARYDDKTQLIPFYFFGLVTLIYLLTVKKKYLPGNNELTVDDNKDSFMFITFLIMAFSFIVPGTGFLLRLSRACIY
ncbi:glycosyltransferase family 87 protein [Legionella antarctica]|nr:glycosyltransferase family 87 protein [Legionella antarctica]